MTLVDENRLKGNYGAAYVSARLSAECLVRPVATDTDVGVDLYCESVDDARPFLHFWMQVKAGAQCRAAEDKSSARCSFTRAHLEYWNRQPVPVFAALVPLVWPVSEEPLVYLVDVSSELLLSGIPEQESVTMKSSRVWQPGNQDDVRSFLETDVPISTARIACRDGLIRPIPTLSPAYVTKSPSMPVGRFKDQILWQIRTTSAFSLLMMRDQGTLLNEEAFRLKLARILEQFDDDSHYENFVARGLVHHAEGEFTKAEELYDRAITLIHNDLEFRTASRSQELLGDIQRLKDRAQQSEGPEDRADNAG